MKLKLFIIALLALLVASCERNIDIPEPDKDGGRIVTISATLPQETRVAYDDATLKLTWETGDMLMMAGYDDGNNFIADHYFQYQSNNNFLGQLVEGATKYKAYYRSQYNHEQYRIWLDNTTGILGYSNDFWNLTQNGSNSTVHLQNAMLLSDETAKPLTAPFTLSAKSSILKLVLNGIPQEVGNLKEIIWTVETAPGVFNSLTLSVTGVTFSPTVNSITAFLSFDPNVMDITANGKTMITLKGDELYQWSKVTGGKDYMAGYRYTGTVSTWNPMINPLSYVAEYNVNPAGDGFVNNLTACDVSGYFVWQEAVDRFHTRNDIANYHLPNQREWRSIAPNNHELVRFTWDKYDPNVSESVTVQNQTISMTSDYRSPANGTYTSYALRYKGTDMISAWKYQFVSTDYDGFTDNDTHLKITSRNVAPSVTVHEIADEMFWDNDNENDVVRCFPASGIYSSGVISKGKYSIFWSSTWVTNVSNNAVIMYSDKFCAAPAHRLIMSAGATVRLFKSPIEDTTGNTENLLIVGDGDDWL